jgi:RNA polymerase sigma factor (sigma-70 family)
LHGERGYKAEHPTSNIQHPTPKDWPRGSHWMLDVGCWLLDVLLAARPMTTSKAAPASAAWFVTTHWSVVLSAQEQPASQSAALETLCRTYWRPLYAYVRRQGHSPADAQDLTQEVFARLLAKNWLRPAAPEKGKFRTFLLVMLRRFLADEWDKARAQKRGGGQVFCVDWSSAETTFLQQPVEHLTPEKLYEQRWALTLLSEVYRRLEREYQEQGRDALFQALRFALVGSRSAVPYAELAERLETTEGALKVAVHRLRQHYRELLRQAIADTVSDPEEIEDELRHLLKAVSG